ncbi:M56 family metallopeptidase [Allofournierella massiliensis]|uniref:M56 family metallopeptidase n=1 Tax=Allofournierella massiliensis TaxID=1650663 RepID=UPI003569C257
MNGLFLKVLNTSISASWLVLAVLLLRFLLRRAPKWISVLLWGIVALRLVLPFSVQSVLSLIPSAETLTCEILSGPSFHIHTGFAPVDQQVNGYLADRYFEGVTVPASSGTERMTLLAFFWAAGTAAMLLYAAINCWRLRQTLRTAIPLRDNLYQSDGIASPFVLGIVRPKIYLPFRLEEEALPYVTAHEQAHIQRKDHWWKPLGFLLLAVHWFNPLLWLSYTLLCRDIELACDERVIRGLSRAGCAAYTQALVAVSLAACAAAAVCFLTDPVDSSTEPDAAPPAQTVASSAEEPQPETMPALTRQNAEETIAQILATLTIHSDHTVSFSLPQILPVAEDGKTELAISLNATFSDAPGSFSVQALLDSETGWQGGEQPRLSLDTGKGELTDVFLGVFYLTEVDTNAYDVYAKGSVELPAPFHYDTPAGYTAPSVQLSQTAEATLLHYTLPDGSTPVLSVQLPQSVTITEGEEQLLITRNGETVGTVTLYPFGTADAQSLQEIDPAEDALPMSVFSTVALSNHVGYESYRVCSHNATGAVATAEFVWQDLSSGGSAASTAWQTQNCILAYDWSVMPYFVELQLAPGLFSQTELTALARTITLA